MSRRVLVVDDEPQILRALRIVLREADFDVLPAATAQEALDAAALRPPDAAIVDLVLPDGDGIEVTPRPARVDARRRSSCSAPSARRTRRSAPCRPAPTTT